MIAGSGTVAGLVLTGLVSFLIGTFPSGTLVCRALRQPDPRQRGSGNIGATNVFRVAGPAAGVLTLVLDLAKGWVAVALAGAAGGELAAVAAVLGHLHPPWQRFRGGKGVATAAGAFLGLAPVPALAALGIFGLVLAGSRIVAVASLAAVAAFPALAVLFSAGRTVAGVGILVAVMVAAGHRENFVRIREGREPKIGRPGDGGPEG